MNPNSYNGPSQLGYGPNFNQQNYGQFNPLTSNNNPNYAYGNQNNNSFQDQVPNSQIKYPSLYEVKSSSGQNGPNIGNGYEQYQNNAYQSNPYQSNQYQGNVPKSENLFGDLLQGGGLNNLNSQMNNLNLNQNADMGMNIWADLAKNLDWDALLKNKNFTKKQSDTSWVTQQEQSWLQPKPSDHIQKQADLKFAFPNPYIKYKIIPGVNQKMALDVTSKDNLQKGLVKGSLIIWDYHGGPNQQFYIHRCGQSKGKIDQDEYILINASTGFIVSAMNLTTVQKNNDPKLSSHLCVFPKIDDIPTQRWKLKPMDQRGQVFVIGSVATGNVLDCENQSRSNGTNVVQWKQNGGKNQFWKILPA